MQHAGPKTIRCNCIINSSIMALRTIGFLGGMTYHSTIPYYTKINQHVQRTLGGSNWASIIMHSFSWQEANRLMSMRDWDAVSAKFIEAGKNMKLSGAEGLVIGCNIGHKVADAIEKEIGLPLLHIADATAKVTKERGLKKIGLLGTRPVMEEGFIKDRLKHRGGLGEVMVPEADEWDRLDSIVFDELGAGAASEESRAWMISLVKRFQANGAEAIVLACTDFQFVVREEDVGSGVLIDTLEVHAKQIADWSTGR